MTDQTLRSLERVAGDDQAAAERLITERIRAGARDPRRDPRAGDEVESEAGLDRVSGGRHVLRTWPQRLGCEVRVAPISWTVMAGSQVHVSESRLLPVGTLVRRVSHDGLEAEFRLDRHGRREAWVTCVVAAPLNDGLWPLLEPVVYSRDGVRAEARVWSVCWSTVDAASATPASRRITGHEISLDAWRRWAKRGTVRRVGS